MVADRSPLAWKGKDITTTRIFEDVDRFINSLMPWGDERLEGKFIFRGHSDHRYLLIPSALRSPLQVALRAGSTVSTEKTESKSFYQERGELSLLSGFYRLADSRGLYLPHVDVLRQGFRDLDGYLTELLLSQEEYWLPEKLLEVAGLAQHYGLPTRLLDWTQDPFVAIYFACGQQDAPNISVWCLDLQVMERRSISIWGHPSNWLLQIVTPFYGGNPNLQAQSGTFTHWRSRRIERDAMGNVFAPHHGIFASVDRRPLHDQVAECLDEFPPEPWFRHHVLRNADRSLVLQRLRQLGYGTSRLFPGYSGVVRELMEIGGSSRS